MKFSLHSRRVFGAAAAVVTAGLVTATLLAAGSTFTYHANGDAEEGSGNPLYRFYWTSGGERYAAGHSGATGDQAWEIHQEPGYLTPSFLNADGSNPAGTFGTDPATIDFWMKAPAAAAGQMSAVMGRRAFCGDPAEGWWDIRVGTSPVSNNPPGTLIVEFGGSSYVAAIGQTNVVDDEWHHIVVQRSNTGISINVDGAPDAAAAGPASDISPSVGMEIGHSACNGLDGTEYPLGFLIDELNVTRGNPGIGPPNDKNQCKNGGWATFDVPRSFKNQGDCIQFVNTGK